MTHIQGKGKINFKELLNSEAAEEIKRMHLLPKKCIIIACVLHVIKQFWHQILSHTFRSIAICKVYL